MLVLQAWRSWRNDKAVAFLAAAAFAAGIGAATAIYTVVNAVMLKPLPYRNGDRFVAVFSATVNDPIHYGSLSFRDARTYQERTRVFDAFGWFRYTGKNLTFGGDSHHIEGVAVTPSLARQLGVNPMLGQWFQNETGVVISAPLWRRLRSDAATSASPSPSTGAAIQSPASCRTTSSSRSLASSRQEGGSTSGSLSIRKEKGNRERACRISHMHGASRM
jgi:hypothetical protein